MTVEPLDIGFNVKIDNEFYRIVDRGYVNVTETLNQISAGGTLGKTTFSEIEPSSDIIYQLGIGLEHDIDLRVFKPNSTQALGTDNNPQGFIDADLSPASDPNDKVAINVPPGDDISIDAVNNSGLVPVTPVLHLTGFKYKVRKLDSKPDTFTHLPWTAFGG